MNQPPVIGLVLVLVSAAIAAYLNERRRKAAEQKEMEDATARDEEARRKLHVLRENAKYKVYIPIAKRSLWHHLRQVTVDDTPQIIDEAMGEVVFSAEIDIPAAFVAGQVTNLSAWDLTIRTKSSAGAQYEIYVNKPLRKHPRALLRRLK